MVAAPDSRVGETFDVVADRHHQLVGDHPFADQVERGGIRHFADHHPGLPEIVGTLEYLSGTERVGLRTIGLYRLHGAGLPAPGMVNQQLCVHSEQTVKQVFVLQGTAGNLAHGIDAVRSQPFGNSLSHPPELGERLVIP